MCNKRNRCCTLRKFMIVRYRTDYTSETIIFGNLPTNLVNLKWILWIELDKR